MFIATPTNFGAIVDIGPMFRLSVDQYHELSYAGILDADDRVELLEGLLVQKMTKHPPHSGTVMMLRSRIEPLLPAGWRYRSEQPLLLSDGEPEPDGVIATGSKADNFKNYPSANETALVIEVADATLARDRGIKLRSYARGGIREYWIVNLIDRQIETFADPDRSASPEPTYRTRLILNANASVSLNIDGTRNDFPVADLLPPA